MTDKDLYEHTMTVAQLIEQLKTCDPDAIVVMAKDGEGNDYTPLAGFWSGVYRAETTWYGEVGYSELTPELEEEGYDEEDLIEDGRKAIILSPTY